MPDDQHSRGAGEEGRPAPTLDDIADSLGGPEDTGRKPPRRPTRASDAKGDDPAHDDGRDDGREAEAADPDEGGDEDDDGLGSIFGSDDDDAPDEASDPDDDGGEGREALHTVKVDGRTRKVPLSELIRAYSGEGAIDARLQQAAEFRQKAEAEASQHVKHAEALTQRIQYAYDHLNEALFVPRVDKPDPSLRDADPIGYMQAMEDWREDQGRIANERQQVGNLLQQAQGMVAQHRQTAVRGELAKLQQAVPRLADQGFAKKFKAGVASAARAAGFSDQEIGSAMDHRLFLLAAKAAAFDELSSGTAGRKAKVTTRREPMPSRGRNPQRVQAGKKLQARNRAVERARRSGKVDDIVDLI